MAETLATVGGTIIALVSVVGVILRSVYKRGRNEEVIASSIDRQAEATGRNTAATVELAAQVGGLKDILLSHGQTLTEHHFRLKALEDREVRVTVK
jgi:hypothetical protein